MAQLRNPCEGTGGTCEPGAEPPAAKRPRQTEAGASAAGEPALRVMTFNVLADCWVAPHPENYAGVDAELLDAAARAKVVLDVVERAGAHIVFLQEVQESFMPLLRKRFEPDHFVAPLARNDPTSASEPNGVTMIMKKSHIATESVEPVIWNSEGSATNVVVGTVVPWKRKFVAVNAHVPWGPGGDDQVERVVAHLKSAHSWPHPGLDVFWCGDFNMEPSGASIQELSKSFSDALEFAPDVHTFHPAEVVPKFEVYSKRVDYVLLSEGLQAVDAHVPQAGSVDLSAMEQVNRCRWCMRTFGSDHVPIVCDIRRQGP
mmetsp:Transcript_24343/g.72550  ORF Transcript_24343/g.72550 Transcript_24343/m.72550 type:complete len:316 (+) Transcript_24343:68-1015(+)